MNKLLSYETFFKTKRVAEIADLIATRIEGTESYYIHKNRYSSRKGNIINKNDFQKILSQSNRPIILSDMYIDLA